MSGSICGYGEHKTEDTERTNDKQRTNKWIVPTVGILVISGIIGLGINKVIKDKAEQEYAAKHLSQYALPQKELKSLHINQRLEFTKYIDLDANGSYESVIVRRNPKDDYVNILVIEGLEGKLEFPNLSKTAVNPLDTLPPTIDEYKIVYEDINNDNNLESTMESEIFGTFQKVNIEKIDNRYLLKEIKQ
jgi:hypothetical protein